MSTLSLPSVRGKLTPDAPLAPLVWFKSGGTADWLFEPKDLADLQDFMAGLAPGMVILQVGRAKVDSPAALDRELAAAKPGDTVMLLVRHRGVTRFVAVTVEKG